MFTRHKFIPVVLLMLAGCATQTMHDGSPVRSGLQTGDDIVPWNPIHVAGPNKGTNACPICTYEARPAIQVFIKGDTQVPEFAERLQKLVKQHQKQEFKGFIIVLDTTPARVKQLGNDLKNENIGLCYPDPEAIVTDLKAYKINPAANNTVILYKDYKVAANFVNLNPADFDRIEDAVNQLH